MVESFSRESWREGQTPEERRPEAAEPQRGEEGTRLKRSGTR